MFGEASQLDLTFLLESALGFGQENGASELRRNRHYTTKASGRNFQKLQDLYKALSLGTDLANIDANTMNYWLRKFVQEIENSDGEVVSSKDLLYSYLWHPKAFQ
ncbi:uncharacterized protein LOC141860622 isoform X3 [Acropora palmata]|uniref:uncharacterized protein LOC141860622 isoform X3 n=1 Tax=Acropora palmata TaxID=6131 RepID=UPI003DA010A3